MKADFTRTIVTTKVEVAEITVVNGTVATAPLKEIVKVDTKKLSEESALKEAKKLNPGKNVVVLGIDSKEEVRGMTFETFMEHSVPVVRPASQQK
jgi:hypothetical protein